jgi:heat-inducible transcriptional repressor
MRPGELKEREQTLLFVLIEEHIATGQAVSSSTILNRGNFDCSSATIRNDLAHLESLGLVEKPHTSSGRIPTETAYKLYAAHVADRAKLNNLEKDLIAGAIGDIRVGIEQVLDRASQYLSDETKLVSLVVSPTENRGVIETIDLVPIASSGIVIILVTSDGHVENQKVNLGVDNRNLEIDSIRNLLIQLLKGKTIQDIDADTLEMFFQKALSHNIYYESIKKPVVEFLTRLRKQQGSVVFSHGLRQLIESPEFAESRRLRAFLRARNEEEFIQNILTDLSIDPSRVKVVIGRDNVHQDLSELSLVFTNFVLSDGMLRGQVGVLGPTRMPYAKIIPLVDFIAKHLTEKLGGRILVG